MKSLSPHDSQSPSEENLPDVAKRDHKLATLSPLGHCVLADFADTTAFHPKGYSIEPRYLAPVCHCG